MSKYIRLILTFILFVSASTPPEIFGKTNTEEPAEFQNILVYTNKVVIQLDKEIQDYNTFVLPKPPRIIIELPNTVHKFKEKIITVKGSDIVNKVRTSQFKKKPKVVRVVLDLAESTEYKAISDKGEITIFLGKDHPGFKSKKTLEADSEDRSKKPKDLLANLPKDPVNIDFEEADIRDILRVLSEMSGINFVYGQEIAGPFTIHLEKVPFDEALNTILHMNGLVAQQMGVNILRIMTPEKLQSERSKAVTAYKTISLNYAKAEELVGHLDPISKNGKISVDSRTNSIIIKDTPEGIAIAERLIIELDQKPKQVMIEAKIVEIQLDDSFNLGIQWEYGKLNDKSGTTIKGDSIGILKSDGSAPINYEYTDSAGNEATIGPAAPTARGTGVSLPSARAEAGITFGFINDTEVLFATLQGLATKGSVKLLSEPKIVTVDNQEASIQVGSDIPFSITTVASTGLATQSFEMVNAGIMLTVTPTISADDRIRLKVNPTVSLPGAVTAAGPEILTRNANTEVIIRNGETLVIGGLIDESIRKSVSKVPLLGDIPILGTFFRSISDSTTRRELLIFLTPMITEE